jgi:putative hydrolase
MTLLEGHADYVMDAVGPEVVPTVDEIRRGFEDRRRSGSPLERVARRLLGLDAKLAQYRIGGAFCRAVARDAGPDALLVAFAGPQNIPTAAEFANPAAWIERTCPVRA